MTLECKITSIHWQWISQFEDVRWNSCVTSKHFSESLLMRNGTGKTTTIILLQNLVAGIIPDAKLLNRAKYKGLVESKELSSKGGDSKFSVTFEINSKSWTLGYNFDDNFSQADIWTQAPDTYHESYAMPNEFKNAFENNIHMTRLLFLDTQEAGQDKLRIGKDSIDGMFKILGNVKILEHARKTYVPNAVERARKISAKQGSANEKKLAEQALRRCKSTIRDIKIERDKAKAILQAKQTRLGVIEKQISTVKKNSLKQEDFKKLEKISKSQSEKIKVKGKILLEQLVNPANMPGETWSEVQSYYEQLSKSRIPKSIAREYLGGILEEKNCICGHAIHAPEKKCIENRMSRSMGLSILSEVYVMKDRVASEATINVKDIRSILEVLVEEKQATYTEIGRLEAQLGGMTQEELLGLGSAKKECQIAIRQLENSIEMYECTIISEIKSNKSTWLLRSMNVGGEPSEKPEFIAECKNLHWLEKIEKALNKKLDTIAGIQDLSDAADIITTLLEKVEVGVLEHIQKKVLDLASVQLDMFEIQNNLTFHSLSDGIWLIPESGGIARNEFSTGEELAVIICLVSALSRITSVSVPMLIDNPTKGSDGLKIDGLYDAFTSMSKLKRQLIMFIYNTERDNMSMFFNKDHTNPSTFMREHEPISGKLPKNSPHGNFGVNYEWNTFNEYLSESSRRGA
jgi:hypothetical protein